MKAKSWWIKERHNPQLGVYYVPCGQMTKTAAKAMEYTLYGDKVAELRKRGANVR